RDWSSDVCSSDLRPSGAAVSNLYQMEALAAAGHTAVLICRLTAERANRDAALVRLRQQGVDVTTDESPLMFVDSFRHGDVQVHAFTIKPFGEWPIDRRLRFPWLWARRTTP